jgi:transposase
VAKKYIVHLEAQERQELMSLVSKGRHASGVIRRARILLQVDVSADGLGWKDAQVAQGLGISIRGIEMLRRRFVEEGLDACLKRRESRFPNIRHKIDGEKEARLIALSCSAPPPGRRRWTLRLLADRLVELQVVDNISHETIRRVLKKAR